MPTYNSDQFQAIQRYRAIVERPVMMGHALIEPFAVALSQQQLELLVAHFHPDTDFTLDPVSPSEAFEAAAGLVTGDDSASSSPYPALWSLVHGDVDPADAAALPCIMMALTELAPYPVVDGNGSPVEHPLASFALSQFDSAHERATEARLARIADQTDPSPFDTVTSTELTYGYSEATLRDAGHVHFASAGVITGAFREMLAEQGHDPDEMLPPGFGEMPLCTGDREPIMGGRLDDTLEEEPDELLTANDLANEHRDDAKQLKQHHKFIRDCLYLRSGLHDRFTGFFESPNVPALAWKEAALAVQNDNDLFAQNLDSLDDDEVPDGLFHPDSTPVGSGDANDGGSATDGNSEQTGLTQFS